MIDKIIWLNLGSHYHCLTSHCRQLHHSELCELLQLDRQMAYHAVAAHHNGVHV